MHVKYYKLNYQIFQVKNDAESYGSNSICVDRIRSLSSVSCGTYTTGSVLPLCVAQETFTINGTNQYVVYLEGMKNRTCF